MKKLLLLVLLMMVHVLTYASSFGVSPSTNTPSTKSTEQKTVSHKTSKSSKGKTFTLFKRKQKRHKSHIMQAPEGKASSQNGDSISDEGYMILGLFLALALGAIAAGFVLSLLWLIITGFSLLLLWLVFMLFVFIIWDLDGIDIKWGH